MLQTKEKNYSKAYVEFYEIIIRLPKQQLDCIPTNLIKNIKEQRNLDYTWIYNEEKSICEQDLMAETKALIVELYEKFLSPDNMKEIWKRYDRLCLNFIENEKHNKLSSEISFKTKDLFKTSNTVATTSDISENITNTSLIEYKETFFTKLKHFIFKILHINQ